MKNKIVGAVILLIDLFVEAKQLMKLFYERYKNNILMFLLLVFMVSGIVIGLIWYKPLFHIFGTVMFIMTLDLLIDKKSVLYSSMI